MLAFEELSSKMHSSSMNDIIMKLPNRPFLAPRLELSQLVVGAKKVLELIQFVWRFGLAVVVFKHIVYAVGVYAVEDGFAHKVDDMASAAESLL